MSFRKILCPVDFSEPSRRAMAVAASMAKDAGAELTLFHVYQPSGYVWEGAAPDRDFLGQLSATVEHALVKGRTEALAAGAPKVAIAQAEGGAADEIVKRLEREKGYDLVVMGTHGRSGIKHALLGSVAENVLRHAPIPVLVVRTRR